MDRGTTCLPELLVTRNWDNFPSGGQAHHAAQHRQLPMRKTCPSRCYWCVLNKEAFWECNRCLKSVHFNSTGSTQEQYTIQHTISVINLVYHSNRFTMRFAWTKLARERYTPSGYHKTAWTILIERTQVAWRTLTEVETPQSLDMKIWINIP